MVPWYQKLSNTPHIICGPNLPNATTHEDKCEALRKELYQPPPPLDWEFNPNLTTQLEDDMTSHQRKSVTPSSK